MPILLPDYDLCVIGGDAMTLDEARRHLFERRTKASRVFWTVNDPGPDCRGVLITLDGSERETTYRELGIGRQN